MSTLQDAYDGGGSPHYIFIYGFAEADITDRKLIRLNEHVKLFHLRRYGYANQGYVGIQFGNTEDLFSYCRSSTGPTFQLAAEASVTCDMQAQLVQVFPWIGEPEQPEPRCFALIQGVRSDHYIQGVVYFGYWIVNTDDSGSDEEDDENNSEWDDMWLDVGSNCVILDTERTSGHNMMGFPHRYFVGRHMQTLNGDPDETDVANVTYVHKLPTNMPTRDTLVSRVRKHFPYACLKRSPAFCFIQIMCHCCT